MIAPLNSRFLPAAQAALRIFRGRRVLLPWRAEAPGLVRRHGTRRRHGGTDEQVRRCRRHRVGGRCPARARTGHTSRRLHRVRRNGGRVLVDACRWQRQDLLVGESRRAGDALLLHLAGLRGWGAGPYSVDRWLESRRSPDLKRAPQGRPFRGEPVRVDAAVNLSDMADLIHSVAFSTLTGKRSRSIPGTSVANSIATPCVSSSTRNCSQVPTCRLVATGLAMGRGVWVGAGRFRRMSKSTLFSPVDSSSRNPRTCQRRFEPLTENRTDLKSRLAISCTLKPTHCSISAPGGERRTRTSAPRLSK